LTKPNSTNFSHCKQMKHLQKVNVQSLNLIQLFVCVGFLALIIVGCSAPQRVTVYNYHNTFEPFNGIKIDDNFFCDQTEITNINYQEYLFWTKQIFGPNSTEFKSTLPDTTLWPIADSCYHTLNNFYFWHSDYNNYPVVGVSQNQAKQYSKWRSDRVFEYYLVNNNFIPYSIAPTAENYFTIEKYFNEALPNVVKDHRVKYYPNFRLPNLAERQTILAYADITYNAFLEKCKSKKCKECLTENPLIRSNIDPCAKARNWDDNISDESTRSVWYECMPYKRLGIYDIKGNVAEWALETNTAYGGSWNDDKEQILKVDTQTYVSPNPYTGFRNVFEWKKWEE